MAKMVAYLTCFSLLFSFVVVALGEPDPDQKQQPNQNEPSEIIVGSGDCGPPGGYWWWYNAPLHCRPVGCQQCQAISLFLQANATEVGAQGGAVGSGGAPVGLKAGGNE